MSVWKYATNQRIVFGQTSRRQMLVQLLGELGLNPERSRELIELGAVYQNQRRICDPDAELEASSLRVHLQPRRFPRALTNWRERILGQTDFFYCIDKPCDVPVHASLDNARENALHQMELLTGETLYPVHRLDVPTSGLVLLARHKKASALVQRWIEQNQVVRAYRALTAQPVSAQIYTHYMKPSTRAPKQVSLTPPGQLCRLEVMRTLLQGDYYEHEIKLHTGRTHQIRAQLHALGAPLLGDLLYGGNPAPRLALQAYQLEIKPLGLRYVLARDYASQMEGYESELKILDNPKGE